MLSAHQSGQMGVGVKSKILHGKFVQRHKFAGIWLLHGG